jgi:hypothetical protein
LALGRLGEAYGNAHGEASRVFILFALAVGGHTPASLRATQSRRIIAP